MSYLSLNWCLHSWISEPPTEVGPLDPSYFKANEVAASSDQHELGTLSEFHHFWMGKKFPEGQ